jgi:hypothetical protein
MAAPVAADPPVMAPTAAPVPAPIAPPLSIRCWVELIPEHAERRNNAAENIAAVLMVVILFMEYLPSLFRLLFQLF